MLIGVGFVPRGRVFTYIIACKLCDGAKRLENEWRQGGETLKYDGRNAGGRTDGELIREKRTTGWLLLPFAGASMNYEGFTGTWVVLQGSDRTTFLYRGRKKMRRKKC